VKINDCIIIKDKSIYSDKLHRFEAVDIMPRTLAGLIIIILFITAGFLPSVAYAKLSSEELGNTKKDEIARYAKNIKDNPADGDIVFSDSRKLVEIHHVKAFEALKELYSSGSDTVKAKILKAIGVQREKAIDATGDYWEIFEKALGSTVKELSDAVVESLAWLESEEYFNRLVEKLKSKDTPKSAIDNAVRALCCFKKSPSNELSLTTATIGLREQAAEALALRGDAAGVNCLKDALGKKLAINFADLDALKKWWESNKGKMVAQILEEANQRLQAEMREVKKKAEKNRRKAVREKILYFEQLLKTDDKKAVALFLKELSDPEAEPEVLVFVMGQLGGRDVKDAFKSIVDKLQSENSDVRIAALQALGFLGDEKALKEVAKKVSNGSHQEKLAAIETVSKLKGEEAARILLESLKEEKDASIQRAVVKALGDVKLPAAIVPLVEMAGEVVEGKLVRLKNTVNNDFLIFVADALGSILSNNVKAEAAQRELAVDYLLAMLAIENGEVKFAAVDNLGNVGAVRAIGELVKVLNDNPIAGVRARAAQAIGKMPKVEESAIDALYANLIKDKEKEVFDSCMRSMRSISGLNGSSRELNLKILKKLATRLSSDKQNAHLRSLLKGLPEGSELKKANAAKKDMLYELHGVLAEAHVEAGDWQLAANELEKVVQHFKDDKVKIVKYSEVLAHCYAALDQAAKAIGEYERLVKLADPQQAAAFWQEYIKLVEKTADDGEKLRRIESALKLTPPAPQVIKKRLERLKQELTAKLPKEPKNP